MDEIVVCTKTCPVETVIHASLPSMMYVSGAPDIPSIWTEGMSAMTCKYSFVLLSYTYTAKEKCTHTLTMCN